MNRTLTPLVIFVVVAYGVFASTGCSGESGRVIDDSRAATRTQRAPDGHRLYITYCMSCHQANGQGIAGVYPPLDGTDWVTGDKETLVRVILHGLTGPMEVKDVRYTGAMPPWGALKDEDVAAVASYVRRSWTNDAPPIGAEEVAAIRMAFKGRKQPWTVQELME